MTRKAPPTRPRCRRCGKALAKVYVTPGVPSELLGYGYGATGLFCSLTCGHWYAVRAVLDGRVLQ